MRKSKDDAEQTRIAILDAAEIVFCELGFRAATLEAISKAAGLTRGAFYWHFKDKIHLLQALHQRNALPQEALIEFAAEHGHEDPFALLEETGVEVLKIFEVDESRQRMFRIMSLQPLGEDGDDWLQRANSKMFHQLKRLASIAKSKGILSPEFTPEEAAVTLMIAMNGLLSEWIRSDKSFGLTAFSSKLLRKNIQILRAEAVNAAGAPPAVARPGPTQV